MQPREQLLKDLRVHRDVKSPVSVDSAMHTDVFLDLECDPITEFESVFAEDVEEQQKLFLELARNRFRKGRNVGPSSSKVGPSLSLTRERIESRTHRKLQHLAQLVTLSPELDDICSVQDLGR